MYKYVSAALSLILILCLCGCMVKLERLSLGGTLVTDLAPLAGMTELRVLDLSSDAFDKFDYGVMDLSPLSGMLKLEKLDLERNVLTDFTPLAELAEILGPDAFKECIGHPTILVPIETITLTDNRIIPILTCKIPIAPDGSPVTMEKYNYASNLEVVSDGTLRFHSNLTPVDEEVASMFLYTAEDMLFDGVVIVHATREQLAYIHAGQP